MKKTLLIIISFLILLTCLPSCDGDTNTTLTTTADQTESTTQTTETTTDTTTTETTTTAETTTETTTAPPPVVPTFVSPSDEKPATRVITTENEDGIALTVTLYGYQSDSLGKEFYAKSNEYMTVDVEIRNHSDASVYQFLATYCRGGTHAHEIESELSNENGQTLTRYTYVLNCATLIDIWEVEANGGGNLLTVKLAAGAPGEYHDYDLPAEVAGFGIKLYDGSIYQDASCTFEGDISFSYSATNDGTSTKNSRSVSAHVSVEFVYVG